MVTKSVTGLVLHTCNTIKVIDDNLNFINILARLQLLNRTKNLFFLDIYNSLFFAILYRFQNRMYMSIEQQLCGVFNVLQMSIPLHLTDATPQLLHHNGQPLQLDRFFSTAIPTLPLIYQYQQHRKIKKKKIKIKKNAKKLQSRQHICLEVTVPIVPLETPLNIYFHSK